MPGLLGQFHALINGGARRNAVQMQKLKSAQPQRNQNLRHRAWRWGVSAGLQLAVELNLPAQHAQHQRRCQIAVGARKSVDGLAAQQIVGVRLAPLNRQQNLKCRLARWGDVLRFFGAVFMLPSHASVPPRALGQRVSAQKLGCRQPLLAFELNFEEFEPGLARAGSKQPVASRRESGPAALQIGAEMRNHLSNGHAMHNQFFPVERRKRSRPRLKSAPAIVELMRSARGKIHAPIFAVSIGASVARA